MFALLLATTAFGVVIPTNSITPVTADGDYSFPAMRAGVQVTYSLSGTFGGGTVTLGYISAAGTFTSFGTTLTAAGSSTKTLPEGATAGQAVPAISLSGATSPSITVSINKLASGSGAVDVSTITGLGTAATTAATSYATATQGMAATANGPLRVACVGTSITFQSSLLATDVNPRIHDLTNGHAGWLEHLTNHKIRLVRRTGVYESSTDKTFGYSGFGLTGLTTGSVGVYPLDNAIASGAEVLVLEGGTNDIAGGVRATIVAKVRAYWTKAINSGARVVALNILPYGGPTIVATAITSAQNGNIYEIQTVGTSVWTSYGAANNNLGTVFTKINGTIGGTGGAINKSDATGSTTRDMITNVNSDLVALATELGVTLIDTHSVATKDGAGYATIETLFDGIHPTPAYAARLAALIAVPLNTFAANRAPEMIVPNQASALWITQSNSPSQNTIPTGWVASGTFTGTYTAVTDADGTTWQRVRMLQTGTANSVMQFSINPSTGFSAGDKIRFCCRIRPVSGGAFDVNEIGFAGSCYDTTSGTSKSFKAITGGANLGTGNYDALTGLFVSPIYVIQATSTALFSAIGFNGNDVQFDIRQYGIYKVIENP